MGTPEQNLRDGRAVIYCEGGLGTTLGKTAHGLIRRTRRYDVAAVIDASASGQDAGFLIDGKAKGIPVVADLSAALRAAEKSGAKLTHFVIGLAPDGGRIDPPTRAAILQAIELGLNIDSGLHDFLSSDTELSARARSRGVVLRDVRKTPEIGHLHSFTGKIFDVEALRIAVLGTDSAVGKRTTAWCLVDGFEALGVRAELIGTGQTAWLQGARYSIILDSLINDYIAGELENAVYSAWIETKPEVIIVEGQGSLMSPAYPGGLEILAATKPDIVVMQHAPGRLEYDGFPGQPVHPLERQIQAVELLSDKPVVAITVNHQGLSEAEIPDACRAIEKATDRIARDVLVQGPGDIVRALIPYLERKRARLAPR